VTPARAVPRADDRPDIASVETRRGARAKWGAVVKGLPHPLYVVIRARPATTPPVLERIKRTARRRRTTWQRGWVRICTARSSSTADVFVVVPAEDLDTLSDRCASLEASMRRIGLRLERVSDPRDALSVLLTPRPHEHVRAFELGKLPSTIVPDWAALLFDGDLPLDVEPASKELLQPCRRGLRADRSSERIRPNAPANRSESWNRLRRNRRSCERRLTTAPLPDGSGSSQLGLAYCPMLAPKSTTMQGSSPTTQAS
jgi:hypothetical protein